LHLLEVELHIEVVHILVDLQLPEAHPYHQQQDVQEDIQMQQY
jgi:hypothetical protein